MKAIASPTGFVHWVAPDDARWTLCGRRVVIEAFALDLLDLPADESRCEACHTARSNTRSQRRSGVTAEPAAGRLITHGPLYHGLGRRRGRSLGMD